MKIYKCLLSLVWLLPVSCSVVADESEVYRFTEKVKQDAFSVYADLVFEEYPPGVAHNPAFEASLARPIRTSKVRLVSNDESVHVTEIRLFGPDTTEYPPALSGKTAGVEAPNLATGATVLASGGFEGRPKEAVIDGMLTFKSRWFSGHLEGPHWLEIDMGQKKVISYIQMVTGYLAQGSATWSAIIKDFRLEYWDDGTWRTLQFAEKPAREAGSFGIKIEGQQGGNLIFLHDNDRAERFAVGKFEEGAVFIEKSYSPASIEEPQKGGNLRIALKKAGTFYHLFYNGRKVAAYDAAEQNQKIHGPLSVSVLPLSKDTAYEVVKTEVVEVEHHEDDLLRNVVIRDLQNDVLVSSNFDPFSQSVHSVLPSVTNEVSVELEASEAQKVYINDRRATTLRLKKPQIDKADPIEIRVVSKDRERRYALDILPVPPSGKLQLAFSDEFETGKLNTQDWFYRRGLRWQSLNTPEAVSVGDGKLRIGLKVENGQQKVGGAISRRVYGFGYYETRAKLTDVKGWHSAFWQYGLNESMAEGGSHPLEANGVYTEIDGFESVTPDAFSTNLHHFVHGLKGKDKRHNANVVDEYHTYGWLWTPEEVCYYFDGKLIDHRVGYPPTRPQNVWLTCVAHPDAETEGLPQEILFDYFRYYEFSDPVDQLPSDAIIVSAQSEGYSESGTWVAAEEDRDQSYQLETNTRKTYTAGSTCEWKSRLQEPGRYEVFVWNPYIVIDPIINERNYRIETAAGEVTASYNPRISGQRWVSLGAYSFDKEGTVTLEAVESGLYRADSIAFVPKD